MRWRGACGRREKDVMRRIFFEKVFFNLFLQFFPKFCIAIVGIINGEYKFRKCIFSPKNHHYIFEKIVINIR